MDYEELLKKYRKKPLAKVEELEIKASFYLCNYGKDIIEKLIPHREPFLLVDKIIGVDLTEGEELIIGSRFISGADPVFKGHFPDFPVYPGSLQVEMAGQLGLCLTYFMVNKTVKVVNDIKPVHVRATKVLGALFLEPLTPENEALLICKRLEYDGYFGKVLSQVIANDNICSVAIAEVIFLDN